MLFSVISSYIYAHSSIYFVPVAYHYLILYRFDSDHKSLTVSVLQDLRSSHFIFHQILTNR